MQSAWRKNSGYLYSSLGQTRPGFKPRPLTYREYSTKWDTIVVNHKRASVTFCKIISSTITSESVTILIFQYIENWVIISLCWKPTWEKVLIEVNILYWFRYWTNPCHWSLLSFDICLLGDNEEQSFSIDIVQLK